MLCVPRLFKSCQLTLVVGALWMSGCHDPGAELPEGKIRFDALVQSMLLGDGPPTFILSRINSYEAYYPLNLPREYQEDGRKVHVVGWRKNYRVLTLPVVEIEALPQERCASWGIAVDEAEPMPPGCPGPSEQAE